MTLSTLIIKLIIFLLILLLGLCTWLSWIFLISSPLQVNIPKDLTYSSIPIKTNVCQIEDFSNDFDGKLVSFKATTYAFDNELILSPLGCTRVGNGTNFFLDPVIKLNDFSETNSNLITILQSQNPCSNQPDYTDIKEVDIRLIGIVNEYYDKDGYKRYSIIPKNIEIISSFRQFTAKAAS